MELLLSQLEESAIRMALASRGWAWPALEICHLFGLALVIGSLVIVDLRILGFAPGIPMEAAQKFVSLTILGLALNLITGPLLVLGDPGHFIGNLFYLLLR